MRQANAMNLRQELRDRLAPRSISLNAAMKGEIIEAIRNEFAFSDVRKRIEREIYSIRCNRLLAEMRAACDTMDANLQTGDWDGVKHRRWLAANQRWTEANNQLSKLQGV